MIYDCIVSYDNGPLSAQHGFRAARRDWIARHIKGTILEHLCLLHVGERRDCRSLTGSTYDTNRHRRNAFHFQNNVITPLLAPRAEYAMQYTNEIIQDITNLTITRSPNTITRGSSRPQN